MGLGHFRKISNTNFDLPSIKIFLIEMPIYMFYSLSIFIVFPAYQPNRQRFSAMILSSPLKSHQIRICILFPCFVSPVEYRAHAKSFFKSSNNDNEEYFFWAMRLIGKASMDCERFSVLGTRNGRRQRKTRVNQVKNINFHLIIFPNSAQKVDFFCLSIYQMN